MLNIERIEHSFIVLTLTRPEAKNALDRRTLTDLAAAIADAANDHALRAVILTGAGDFFASGGDLRELRRATSAAEAESFAAQGAALCASMAALPVPVIAALPGPALGGGAELALACDLRVADPSARISFKHARMGVTPAWGTTARLTSLVGHSAAARVLFTAHEISATDARAMGLVDDVTPPGAALATALSWARDVALGSPRAVAEMKALLHTARTRPGELDADERRRFVATWTGEDHRVAVEAYFDKTRPV